MTPPPMAWSRLLQTHSRAASTRRSSTHCVATTTRSSSTKSSRASCLTKRRTTVGSWPTTQMRPRRNSMLVKTTWRAAPSSGSTCGTRRNRTCRSTGSASTTSASTSSPNLPCFRTPSPSPTSEARNCRMCGRGSSARSARLRCATPCAWLWAWQPRRQITPRCVNGARSCSPSPSASWSQTGATPSTSPSSAWCRNGRTSL